MSLDDLEDRAYEQRQLRRLEDEAEASEAEAALDGLVSRPPAAVASGLMPDDGGQAGVKPTGMPRHGQRLRQSILAPSADPSGVKYTTWTALVLEALARSEESSHGTVGLPAVAAALGFQGLTWDDFAKGEGMPHALMTAMSDLQRLGLVSFENVDYGNGLTPVGRDVVDAGLASIWPELAKIHLSAREASFLSKLYELSAIDGERWADFLFADADEVAGILGFDARERADLLRGGTLLADLERKGLLEAGPRFGGGPILDRPTYIAAVLLSATVEGGLTRAAVPIEGSTSPPGSELKPGQPRPKGRPKGSHYIADRQAVIDAYQRAKQRPHRNPSKTPSLEIVANELDVSARTLAEYLKTQGIPWPPE